MKLKKLMLAFVTLLIIVPAFTAYGATARFLENCYVDEGENSFVVLCSPSISADGSLASDSLEVTLSGEKIDVTGVTDSASAGTPVTYCCLVDVSGSMNTAQVQQAKDALLAVVDSMRDQDNMAIATLGNTLSQYEFTSDKDELTKRINALEPGIEDTNLYAGIVSSISTLRTGGSVNLKRNLIILSDGMDDMISGFTRDEAIRAVEGSGVPVYTVATLRNKSQTESAKSLGEFARLSSGGAHFAPVIDGITGADAGYGIVKSVNSGYVITTDISSLDTGIKDEIMLLVRARQSDGSIIEDSLTIYAEDLPKIAPEPEPEPEPQPEPEPEPEPEPKTNIPLLAKIIALAIILILLLIIIILIVKKSKKKAVESDVIDQTGEIEAENIEENNVLVDDLSETGEVVFPDVILNNPSPVDEIDIPPVQKSGINIKFTRIGGSKGNTVKNVSFFLPEGEVKSIGRDNRADFILDSQDRRLSGVNSRLIYTDGRLYIGDAGSTNGTFHNGVPLHVERVKLDKDDKITVGSYEYRVTW